MIALQVSSKIESLYGLGKNFTTFAIKAPIWTICRRKLSKWIR